MDAGGAGADTWDMKNALTNAARLLSDAPAVSQIVDAACNGRFLFAITAAIFLSLRS